MAHSAGLARATRAGGMVDVAGQGLQRPPTVQMLDPASTSAYEHIVAERRCERDKRMR